MKTFNIAKVVDRNEDGSLVTEPITTLECERATKAFRKVKKDLEPGEYIVNNSQGRNSKKIYVKD